MYTELVSTFKYLGFSIFFVRNPSNLARGHCFKYYYLKKVLNCVFPTLPPRVLLISNTALLSSHNSHSSLSPPPPPWCHCCVALLEVVAASSMLRHPDSVKEGLIPNDLLVLR